MDGVSRGGNMTARWRVLDCSQTTGKISAGRGNLKVTTEAGSREFPCADLAVALIGLEISISTGAIHRLIDNGVAVLFCDWKGVPYGGSYPWSKHTRVGARQRSQSELSLPRQKNAWARIVYAKVLGQARVLSDHDRPGASQLQTLAKHIRSGDPENIEAHAARIYWRSLWGEQEFHRIPGKGHHDDVLNAALDYAYTVLRGHGIRAVLAAGLMPAFGVFHRGRSNNFALVDDLIEPFRPAIDDAVFSLPTLESGLDSGNRRLLVEATSRAFCADGQTIPSAFNDLAQHFGQYVENEIKVLPVVAWSGVRNG